MLYIVPNPGMTANQHDDGTSAATPLWASLASQINAIFADQGLTNLGYMNDLLYIAAVIAPASFSDITIGNSTSSFLYGGELHQRRLSTSRRPATAIRPGRATIWSRGWALQMAFCWRARSPRSPIPRCISTAYPT